MPNGLTGEHEIAWISHRLIGCNPASGSPVWVYREKLSESERRRMEGAPSPIPPPKNEPPTRLQLFLRELKDTFWIGLIASVLTPPEKPEQRVNDEQEKARNRRAFERSKKMAETVRRQQYEKLHGQGYSRPDGSWVSMRDEPPWKDWGFHGPGGKWVWRRGYEPPPGMYGAPPDPPAVQPPTSAPPTPARNPLHTFAAFYAKQKSVVKAAVGIGVVALTVACGFFPALFPVTWVKVVFGLSYVVLALCVLVVLWETITRKSLRFIATFGAFVLFALGAFASWKFSVRATEPLGSIPDARSPVMLHKPVIIDFADMDGTGHRIFIRARLDSTVTDVITFTHYGRAVLMRPANTDEDALALLEPLKDDVTRIASAGGAVVSILEPMNENVPIYILGPHATEKQWHDFLAGRTRLYFFDLLFPKLADKRRFARPICGIARAEHGMFVVPDCPSRAGEGDI